MRSAALLGLGLLVPLASATALELSVDAFYTADAKVRVENRNTGNTAKLDGGDGEGLRVVAWQTNSRVFYSAELANVRDADNQFRVGNETFNQRARYEQIRLGVGVINTTAFYSRMEVVRTNLRSEQRSLTDANFAADSKRTATGLTGLVGIAGALYPRLLASIEVGYQDLDLLKDDGDDAQQFGHGFIGTARFDVPVMDRVQLFGEYRHQQARDTLRTDLSEVRLGVRFNVL